MKTFTGGCFNLLRDRDIDQVMVEVNSALDKHDMDWLVVNEASQYKKMLSAVGGYDYFYDKKTKGGSETGILVKRGLGKWPAYKSFGDGWITVRGGKKPPNPMPRVTVEGVRIAGIHFPPSTIWKNGGLTGPVERIDDYIVSANKVIRLLCSRRKRVIAIGDYNEEPTTRGRMSPLWIAIVSDSDIAFPVSREGHGRIDGAIVKGVHVDKVFKDLELREASDHELVVLVYSIP